MSCKIGKGDILPGGGVKHQGREANHSPPTNAEVKKTWIHTSTPPILHGVVVNQLNTGTDLLFTWYLA
jgi:hypothetical protein